MTREQHPFGAVIPGMTGDEFEELRADIKANGQYLPILLYQGMVLDGWHRQRVCDDLGIEAKVEKFDGDDDAAMRRVISSNLARRHLSTAQRAVTGMDLKKLEAERAKARSGTRTDLGAKLPEGEAGPTLAKVAKLVGVSEGSIKAAARIEKDAPELIALMRAGEMSIPEAERAAKKIAAATGGGTETGKRKRPRPSGGSETGSGVSAKQAKAEDRAVESISEKFNELPDRAQYRVLEELKPVYERRFPAVVEPAGVELNPRLPPDRACRMAVRHLMFSTVIDLPPDDRLEFVSQMEWEVAQLKEATLTGQLEVDVSPAPEPPPPPAKKRKPAAKRSTTAKPKPAKAKPAAKESLAEVLSDELDKLKLIGGES